MSSAKLVPILTAATLGVLIIEGKYFLRWLTVITFGITLAIILFGAELGLPAVEIRKKENRPNRRDEVKALSRIIRQARKGKTAREIIVERIIEIYASASEDYSSTYSRLRSSPNEAIKKLRMEGDFVKNLEEALKIVEAEINED
ncbi:hypothetical protein [Thermococcus gorgonarius]|uniref:Uncharacterized protein n=1 Tax=Thermococcus gorgonarius TaxID=71997 RepID=A0A2Z2M659_THEGO|nr:hypothetical protein [Thermococcus gorgonarius]ASJ01557.1 hypothetical protein A3K92_08725 [Thermococcus gorgonarius]